MDYGDEAPFMTYGVANPDGTLRQEVEIEIPGPRLPHDLGFTTNYTILHDLPFFHDLDVLRNHNMRVLKFHPRYTRPLWRESLATASPVRSAGLTASPALFCMCPTAGRTATG